MKRSLFSAPDAFSLSPLVSLLPVRGRIGKLEALTSSLYARYERAKSLQNEPAGSSTKLAVTKRYTAEAAMLEVVLDWLSLSPERSEKVKEERTVESNTALRRSSSDLLKRAYSDEELEHLYELGRFLLENGDYRRAETILSGLNEVAADFAPAWLGTSCVLASAKDFDGAVHAARQALKADADLIEALLMLSCHLLSSKDFNAAGSYLGEVGERIEGGSFENPNILRFYRAQLARYQNR